MLSASEFVASLIGLHAWKGGGKIIMKFATIAAVAALAIAALGLGACASKPKPAPAPSKIGTSK